MGARFAMGGLFLWIALAMNISYLASVVLFARVLRLGVTEYALGMGPVLLRRGSFSLRPVPLVAWFDPARREGFKRVDPESRLGIALVQGRLRYFEDVPFAAFVGMALVSAVIALVGTAACLGWGVALEATMAGLRVYVDGAVSPISEGRRLLDSAFADYSGAGARSFVGHALALLGGMNLLWLPSSIMFLLAVASNSVWLRVRFLVWLVARATEVSWLVGFVVWALRA
jgi:hypothetical protein